MTHYLVFTFIGPDRPGLVEQLAATVADHGGNWLESRMSQLAGQFAGVVRVAIDAEKEQSLATALDKLEARGLRVVCQHSDETAPGDAHILHLHIVGNDRPGIVREVSRALAHQQLNVTDMHTRLTSAAMTADPLFEADADIQLPADFNRDSLEDALDQIADQLSVDIVLSDALTDSGR